MLTQCLPIERIWPTKCDRCITKGLPCSESKRTDRKNDHTPKLTQNNQLDQVQPIQIHEQEDHLRQWQVLYLITNATYKPLTHIPTILR